ncbi:hypothetical protein BH10ACI2_BH10ACI2_01450 [soil metagenome]
MDDRYTGVVFEFGSFRADTLKRQLSYNGEPVPLTAKAFDTLVLLIRHGGETVSRTDFVDTIWADTAVEENNLTQQISALRKLFGEHPGDHKFIVTVSGKGYSFVAPVRRIDLSEQEKATKVVDAVSRRSAISPILDRARLTGYAVASWFILIVCFPFILAQFRTPASHPQSVAVLNFRSAGDDRSIGTGISDTLRARLGSVEDITVRPVYAVREEQDVLSAGRELAVDAVLTGSIQRSDDKIRVTVEMVDVAGGRILWGKTFDDTSANIFALQDSIAGEVARALRVRFTSSAGKMTNRIAAVFINAS